MSLDEIVNNSKTDKNTIENEQNGICKTHKSKHPKMLWTQE